MPEKVRLFFGLPISDQQALTLKEHIYKCSPKIDSLVRWVKSGNFHATVRFIGYMGQDETDKIIQTTSKEFVAPSAFELEVIRIAPFPYKSSKLLAGHCRLHQNLAIIFQQIEKILVGLDQPANKHPLRPHITLCRPNKNSKITFNDIEIFQKIPVSEVILYYSQQTQEGNIYIPLKKFHLN